MKTTKQEYLMAQDTKTPASDIIDALRWRYATKQFDPTRKVSEEDLNELLEAARLSASSMGLQPWKLLVITDPGLRARLREHAWGQPQVTDASHLIVLCARKSLDNTYIKRFVRETAKARDVTVGSLQKFEQMLIGFGEKRTPEDITAWSQRQLYIVLGTLLLVAAEKRIDACPMEGFDPQKFDETLGLDEYTATALCPIGYRAAGDKYATLAKVRFPIEEVVEHR